MSQQYLFGVIVKVPLVGHGRDIVVFDIRIITYIALFVTL